MSRNHAEFLDLAAGYALDALDVADRERFQAHLDSGCAECAAAVQEFSAGAAVLGASLDPVTPPPGVRARVLGSLPDRGPAQAKVTPIPERKTPWLTYGALAAAAALAVTTVLSSQRADRYRVERDTLVTQLSQLQGRLDDAEKWLALASSPGSRRAALARTPDAAPTLEGWATFEPGTGSAIVVLVNAEAPTAQDYELWALRGDGPTSLGVVQADETGLVVLRLEDIGDPASIAGFAVSLEPDGGSPQATPTSPVVLAGTLGS